MRRSLQAVSPLIPMLACVAITIGNLFLNLFHFANYADYNWVTDFIAKNTAEPRWPGVRWLIHINLQRMIFHTFESMFFARAFLPGFAHDPLSVARVLNVLVLAMAGLHCYAFYPRRRNTVAWVITSAAYCFMSTGYAKVYGSATAILLLLYCSLEESDFDLGGVVLGVISAFVGLYYLGMWPIAFAILLTVLIKRTNAFVPALLTFVLAGFVFVTIFWGHDVPSYFESLWSEVHFGDKFTDYQPYRGQASSPNSIFFTLPFIFSAKYLVDKTYMLFFSGAMMSLAGVCYEAGRFITGGRALVRRIKHPTPMAVFCCLSFGFYFIVLVGYLSKNGPRMDLAFYSPFIVPFTFMWFQLRRARSAGDLSSKAVWIGQVAYMVVIVVWSGIVGPPEI